MATVHQSSKFLAGKEEEIKGSPSTNLIEEWVGLVHAMVRGPPATTTAKTEQSSTIPQSKEKRAPGGGEGGCGSRDRARVLLYRAQKGQ